MGLPILKTQQRLKFGKSSSKKIRASGLVPAVIYGEKQDPVHISFDPRDIQRLFRNEKKGRNTVITIEIENEKKKLTETVMTYQLQINPITRMLMTTNALIFESLTLI